MAQTADWEQFPALETDGAGQHDCNEVAAEAASQQGDAALVAGKLQEAANHFRTALLHCVSETTYAKLIAAEISRNRIDLAIQNLQAGLQDFPGSIRLHFLQATASAAAGDIATAEIHIDTVLSKLPDSQIALALKAGYRSYHGDYDAAYAILKPLLKMAKPSAKAVLRFARIASRFGEEKTATRMLLDITKNKKSPREEQLSAHFRAGDLFDKQGQYDPAFYHFQKGNALAGGNFTPENIERYVDTLIQGYTDIEAMPKSDVDSTLPVFVVGMPRSGTSLVEKILSSHPRVNAGGELQFIRQIAANLGKNTQQQPYPLCINAITSAQLNHDAKQYLQEISGLAEGADRFTEKLPHNFLYLGLINQLLPNSRVIHCVRDPVDVCLSCYFQNFSGSHPYSNNLKHLADYYLQYHRIMEHWKTVITLPVFTLYYHELVAQPEKIIQQMVEFIGIPWDENCLNFHKTKGIVATASAEQVRSPIYSSSVSRWKNYKRYIKPLKKLEQLVW